MLSGYCLTIDWIYATLGSDDSTGLNWCRGAPSLRLAMSGRGLQNAPPFLVGPPSTRPCYTDAHALALPPLCIPLACLGSVLSPSRGLCSGMDLCTHLSPVPLAESPRRDEIVRCSLRTKALQNAPRNFRFSGGSCPKTPGPGQTHNNTRFSNTPQRTY